MVSESIVNVNMDECISNLVVTTDNYVVHPVENIPIPMVDGNYENVSIAHLVSAGHHTHAGPGKPDSMVFLRNCMFELFKLFP